MRKIEKMCKYVFRYKGVRTFVINGDEKIFVIGSSKVSSKNIINIMFKRGFGSLKGNIYTKIEKKLIDF